jgi:hypothetical protein
MGGNSNYVHGETSVAGASNYANQQQQWAGMLSVVCSIVIVTMWLICNQGVVLTLTYSSKQYRQLLQQLQQPPKLVNQSRVHLLQQI